MNAVSSTEYLRHCKMMLEMSSKGVLEPPETMWAGVPYTLLSNGSEGALA